MPVKTAADLREEREAKLAKQVYLKGDAVVINVTFEYIIALNRCDTPEKLLAWVCHIAEKGWMTGDVLCRFVETACKQNGILLPQGFTAE